MKTRIIRIRGAVSLAAWMLCIQAARAQPADDPSQPEFPLRPKPAWVEPVDQKESNPKLAGVVAPRGIRVEIVAQAPVVVRPERLAFADYGTLHVLQPSGGSKKFDVQALHDRDGDGSYDESTAVMSDWEAPGGFLLVDGWTIWTSGGSVLRRRPHDADLLLQLQAAAEAKRGPPTVATADGKWIEQSLISGLAGIGLDRGGGLMLDSDGWLYMTAGSGDHRAQSWDGSRAVVLRTGAIFRMRADGSMLQEYARGLHQPRGGIAIDELGNFFHLDDDLPGGGRFEGVRLLHVLEGGEYGWRQRDRDDRPDLARAAAWGERPGTLPGVLKTGLGSPAGLLIIRGTQFPEFVRGVLIHPDPDRKVVRGYRSERSGETFKVAEQFDLLRSDDPHFRPSHAVQGPDGAIYVASGHGEHSRIYRLSWGGSTEHPPIPFAPLDSWQQIAAAGEDQLTALLSSDEFELRRRAALELISRARTNPDLAPSIAARATTIAYDDSRRPVVRAAAIAVAAQVMDATALEALLLMLGHDDPDIQRLAAQALADHPPAAAEPRQRLVKALQEQLFVQHPGVPYAMLLAHGKVAGGVDNAEWAFEATSVTYRPPMGPQVFTAHVRALEMTKNAARELLLGNLDVAVNFPDADLKEKERLKEFVAATAEAMRSRELTVFLDTLLRGEGDLLAKLDPPHQIRLIAAYRNVQVDPPVNADAVAEWLDKHPGQPFEIELAALETLSLVGTTKPEFVTKLAEHLLAKPDHAKEAARRFLAGRLSRELQEPIAAALRKHAPFDSTGDSKTLLEKVLKPEP